MQQLFSIAIIFVYFTGIVIAKGVWSTIFAVLTPWGFYLVVEKILLYYNLV